MNQYAPTKAVNVDDDVLAVLAQMKWTEKDEQVHGVIVNQLDRSLYLKTNKVLAELGGKWNRKAKAHIFALDPRPKLGLVIKDGTLEVVKDGFYATPRSVGIVMAEMAELEPGIDVLEPSAGMGDLARAIWEVEPMASVMVIEIDDQRRAYLEEHNFDVVAADFLTYHIRHERIIQNPPFEAGQDIDHVLHAWDCLLPGGILVSVMGEGAFFRNDRKALAFRAWLHEHGSETLALDAGTFHESGTDVRARIVKVAKR